MSRLVSPSYTLTHSDIGDYTTGGTNTPAHAIDSTLTKNGSDSIRLTAGSVAGSTAWIDARGLSITTGRNGGVWQYWLYFEGQPSEFRTTFYTSSQSPLSSKYLYHYGTRQSLQRGWNCMTVHSSQMTVVGGEALDDTIQSIRVLVQSDIGGGRVWLGPVYFRSRAQPQIVLCFDDGYESVIDNAAPLMDAASVKGTIFLKAANFGTSVYASEAQIKARYDLGWDVCYQSTAGTQSDKNNDVATAQSVSAAATFTLAESPVTFADPRHLSFVPAGNEETNLFTIVGKDENGDAQTAYIVGINGGRSITEELWTEVTSVSSEDNTDGNVAIWSSYTAEEIQDDYEAGIAALVAAEMPRGANYHAYNQGALTRTGYAATRAAGVTASRTTQKRPFGTSEGDQDLLTLSGYMAASTSTTDDIKGWIDEIVTSGGSGFIGFHHIGFGSGSLDYSTANFTTVLNYLIAMRDTGRIELATFDELVNGLSSPSKIASRVNASR